VWHKEKKMASYRIVSQSTIKNAIGKEVKTTCQVVFIKDDLTESPEQYWECDYFPDVLQPDGSFKTFFDSSLQLSADEYNSRV
jgi:hypothetical protein